jgi:hypothetical protein
MEKVIIVSNNVMVSDAYKDKHEVIFIQGTLMDVLIKSRDLIHLGHTLLTHPLMGSIKPNQTPYKTVALSLKSSKEVDMDSLEYIEKSISSVVKFLEMKPLRDWPESVLKDFRLIDYDLINNALCK